MALVCCPECGESGNLSGSPGPGGVIALTCGACGATWERDPTRRCLECGSADLRYTPRPLWEKGRGDQRTPAGRFDAWACNECGRADATRA